MTTSGKEVASTEVTRRVSPATAPAGTTDISIANAAAAITSPDLPPIHCPGPPNSPDFAGAQQHVNRASRASASYSAPFYEVQGGGTNEKRTYFGRAGAHGAGCAFVGISSLAAPEVRAQDEPMGLIRVVHGLRGLVADIYLDGTLTLPTFQPERSTEPLPIPAGDHLIEIRSAGAAMTDAPLSPRPSRYRPASWDHLSPTSGPPAHRPSPSSPTM